MAISKDQHQEVLSHLIFGTLRAQVFRAAGQLRLADHLAKEPLTSAELAAKADLHEPSLRRLLLALETMDVVTLLDGEKYELTSLGQRLREDVPDSVRDLVLCYNGQATWHCWSDLADIVRTGVNTFERVDKKNYFEYLKEDPEEYALFNGAMADDSRNSAESIANGFDFSRFGTVMDVGGGNGTLISNIAAAHQGVQGIVFDLPTAVDTAEKHFRSNGVEDRCRAIGGDVFTEVPGGADAYVMKSFLHDWDDEHVTTILTNIRKVIGENGRVLVVEPLLPDNAHDVPSFFGIVTSDLDLLAATQGKIRTTDDFRRLFRATGFELTEVTPLGSYEFSTHDHYNVLEAVPR
ncbi:methyltransferase [Streptomyces sp.]|uniref:methyltransferase n=1 Tax=Streptomyces sp. TaxID=1931 RepID=UPI002C8B8449|nr:methyltransferase [Streptomyces sp.]HLL33506.1 methyltransferase [Streptomyces sp.]HZF86888.1 methyltransferase [Streptomyces sp.]